MTKKVVTNIKKYLAFLVWIPVIACLVLLYFFSANTGGKLGNNSIVSVITEVQINDELENKILERINSNTSSIEYKSSNRIDIFLNEKLSQEELTEINNKLLEEPGIEIVNTGNIIPENKISNNYLEILISTLLLLFGSLLVSSLLLRKNDWFKTWIIFSTIAIIIILPLSTLIMILSKISFFNITTETFGLYSGFLGAILIIIISCVQIKEVREYLNNKILPSKTS